MSMYLNASWVEATDCGHNEREPTVCKNELYPMMMWRGPRVVSDFNRWHCTYTIVQLDSVRIWKWHHFGKCIWCDSLISLKPTNLRNWEDFHFFEWNLGIYIRRFVLSLPRYFSSEINVAFECNNKNVAWMSSWDDFDVIAHVDFDVISSWSGFNPMCNPKNLKFAFQYNGLNIIHKFV